MELTPGSIQPDCPTSEYDAVMAYRQSVVKKAAVSLGHVRHALDHPDQFAPTPAMQFGTLVHALALGSDVDYVRADEGLARTQRKAWAEYCEQFPGSVVIPHGEYSRALAVAETALDYLPIDYRVNVDGTLTLSPFKDTMTEAAVFWAWRGLMCKARVDCYDATTRTLYDLKVTADPTPAAFQRTAARFGYFEQAAYYSAGLNANGADIDNVVIIAVSSVAPYYAVSYSLAAESVDIGHRNCVRWLDDIYRATASNCWPMPESDGDLELPHWAIPNDTDRDVDRQFDTLTQELGL